MAGRRPDDIFTGSCRRTRQDRRKRHQVHCRYKKGPPELHRTSCNSRLFLPLQHLFPGSE